MTRKEAIANIRTAGIEGDKQALVRLYVENRISYTVALSAYAEGVKMRLADVARRAGEG